MSTFPRHCNVIASWTGSTNMNQVRFHLHPFIHLYTSVYIDMSLLSQQCQYQANNNNGRLHCLCWLIISLGLHSQLCVVVFFIVVIKFQLDLLVMIILHIDLNVIFGSWFSMVVVPPLNQFFRSRAISLAVKNQFEVLFP